MIRSARVADSLREMVYVSSRLTFACLLIAGVPALSGRVLKRRDLPPV